MMLTQRAAVVLMCSLGCLPVVAVGDEVTQTHGGPLTPKVASEFSPLDAQLLAEELIHAGIATDSALPILAAAEVVARMPGGGHSEGRLADALDVQGTPKSALYVHARGGAPGFSVENVLAIARAMDGERLGSGEHLTRLLTIAPMALEVPKAQFAPLRVFDATQDVAAAQEVAFQLRHPGGRVLISVHAFDIVAASAVLTAEDGRTLRMAPPDLVSRRVVFEDVIAAPQMLTLSVKNSGKQPGAVKVYSLGVPVVAVE